MDNGFILDYLSDLSKNNNREWFQANKERYEHAIELYRTEISQLIAGCGEFDPSVAHLTPRDCIYRIYRDIRFSPDKTPYKRHFSAYIAMQGGRNSPFGGYYLHLEPGASVLGGGIYCPDTNMLRNLRQLIDSHFEEFEAIISDPKFKEAFGKLDSPEKLKRLPMGFSADSPAAEYLNYKHFLVERKLTDAEIKDPNIVTTIVEDFKKMHPMLVFFNDALLD